MIKKITISLLLLISVSHYSQKLDLDKYQYIVVADKFEFLKNIDQYQTSSLTKFLFKKKKFTVFLSNEGFPKELTENRCLALFAKVKDESSMFTVKSSIVIEDCFGKIVYTSKLGKSKEKDFKKGYQESIRDAFNSMEDFNYSYNPSLKNKLNPALIDNNVTDKVVTPVKIIPKPAVSLKSDKIIKKEKVFSESLAVLYAQPTNNGFQLINTKPEVVLQILKTNLKDTYIIKEKNGVLYKFDNVWVAEYYENNIKLIKKYNVKF